MLLHVSVPFSTNLLAPAALTATILGTLAGLAWWLYLSNLGSAAPRTPPRGTAAFDGVDPGQQPAESHGADNRLSSRAVTPILTLGAAMLVIGSWWDASMHVRVGKIPAGADFLWPPHLLIYGSFLATLCVGLLALVGASRRAGYAWRTTRGDPRPIVRAEPLLGAICLCSAYVVLAVPADALWHEVVGVDLTAWSPPHILLAGASVAVMVLAAANHVQEQRGWEASATSTRPGLAWPALLLGLALGVLYMLASIEWELPGAASAVAAARPDWIYPVVSGGAAALILAVSLQVLPVRYAATAVALVFYASRVAVGGVLDATGNPVPHVPINFLVGAFVLDVRHQRPRRSTTRARDAVVDGILFAMATLAATMPLLLQRDSLHLPLSDWPILVLAFVMVASASFGVAERIASGLSIADSFIHTSRSKSSLSDAAPPL